jgi:hypothetical protein
MFLMHLLDIKQYKLNSNYDTNLITVYLCIIGTKNNLQLKLY